VNLDRAGRARVCISALSVFVGLYVIVNAGFSFSGAGEGGFVRTGDSYFVSGLFQLNALGGAVLLLAGILGALAVLQRTALLAWAGVAVCAMASLVVMIGVGDAKTLVGRGDASNASVFSIVALGLAVTQWAAAVDTEPVRR
jgi:hypothetical protein